MFDWSVKSGKVDLGTHSFSSWGRRLSKTFLDFNPLNTTCFLTYNLARNRQTTPMKSKNANKKRKAAQVESHRLPKIARPVSPPDSDESFEPRSIQTVVSDEELEIAVETLTTLAQYPGLIKSKPCKDLRTAVHEFRQACTTGVNAAGKLSKWELVERR